MKFIKTFLLIFIFILFYNNSFANAKNKIETINIDSILYETLLLDATSHKDSFCSNPDSLKNSCKNIRAEWKDYKYSSLYTKTFIKADTILNSVMRHRTPITIEYYNGYKLKKKITPRYRFYRIRPVKIVSHLNLRKNHYVMIRFQLNNKYGTVVSAWTEYSNIFRKDK